MKNGSIVVVFTALLLALLACGSGTEPEKVGTVEPQAADNQQDDIETTQEEPDDSQPTNAPTQTDFKIGDLIELGDITLVVLGWSKPAGESFAVPDEGKMFVAVDVLVVNRGTQPAQISAYLQMNLKDSENFSYDPDIMASTAIGTDAPDGEVSAGERLRGTVGFQVPNTATGLVFVYDASLFGSGKVFVELGQEPMAVEPPAEIAGETAQETFAIGDVIELGSLNLTVNSVAYSTGDSFAIPEAGNHYVSVELTLENTGAETLNISSVLQMSIKDPSGQTYSVDFMASSILTSSLPEGELAPGETIRGFVGFQVPTSAADLVFVYDADIFGFGKARIALTPPAQ